MKKLLELAETDLGKGTLLIISLFSVVSAVCIFIASAGFVHSNLIYVMIPVALLLLLIAVVCAGVANKDNP